MSKFLLLIIDAVLFLGSIFLALFLRQLNIDHFFYWTDYIPLFIPIVLTSYIFSIYDLNFLRKHGLKKTFLALFFINILFGMGFFYLFSGIMNLGTPKTTLFSSLSIFYLAAYFTRKQFLSFKDKRGLLVKKIVIIGVSSTINEIKQNLLNNKEYKVIFEYASLDEQKGNIENYTKKNIDFIVIQNGYLFNRDTAFWKPLAKNFVNKGITIKTDFDFYEELFGRIPDESVKESLWLIKTIAERDEYGVYKILKRSIDILVSLLAVLLFFIPFLFIWLVIKIVDGYNPVFKQKRIGYLGKTFYIYKFRTMKQKKNDTAAKEVFNEYNKEQSEYGVTGKILRRFRLDEIPQLINLIKGDLSLVGPRPVWDKEYETAEKQISNYSLRNIVRPGIAGWAQLNFRAVRNIEDCVIRFAYDIYYIKNKSFFLDISIILKTIRRLFISDKKMG